MGEQNGVNTGKQKKERRSFRQWWADTRTGIQVKHPVMYKVVKGVTYVGTFIGGVFVGWKILPEKAEVGITGGDTEPAEEATEE